MLTPEQATNLTWAEKSLLRKVMDDYSYRNEHILIIPQKLGHLIPKITAFGYDIEVLEESNHETRVKITWNR